jgi:hypothetical protein
MLHHNTLQLAPTGTASDENQPPIVASNIKLIGQGDKIASASLWIRKWRWTWYGAEYHRRGDSEWISLPNRGWLDSHGNIRYAAIGKFDTDEITKALHRLGIEAIRRAGGDLL